MTPMAARSRRQVGLLSARTFRRGSQPPGDKCATGHRPIRPALRRAAKACASDGIRDNTGPNEPANQGKHSAVGHPCTPAFSPFGPGRIAHQETAHTEYGGERTPKQYERITRSPKSVEDEEQGRALTKPEGHGASLPHDAKLLRRQTRQLSLATPRIQQAHHHDGERGQNLKDSIHTRTIPLCRQRPQHFKLRQCRCPLD